MTPLTEREQAVIGLLSSASIIEIAEWIRARLHGIDTIGGARDESPRALVAYAYNLLNHATRADVRFAAFQTLAEVAHPPSEWSDAAAAELLLLADPIFTDTPPNTAQRAQITEMLTRIAQPASHRLRDRPEVRMAATQALLAMDANPVPRFWFQLYEDYGPPYAPFVVEALIRTDISALTVWLIERLPDTALEDALLNLLPFMVAKHGSGSCTNALRQLHPRLSLETREELEQITRNARMELGKAVPQVSAAAALSHALDTIIHLIPEPSTVIAEALRQAIAETLAKTREALNDASSINPDRTWELWGKYVDCADRALTHSALIGHVLPELIHGLPSELVDELVRHLIMERGVAPSQLARITGITPTLRPEDIGESGALVLPSTLRGKLIVELSLVSDERTLRDQLNSADVDRLNELVGYFDQ